MQFGGALAATLVPLIGAGGSVVMRLLFATLLLLALVSPRWRGHSRRAWLTVLAFGLALGLMNFTFYSSLAHLPIGVAVTVEFLGPLALAAALSRRLARLVAVARRCRSASSSSPRPSTTPWPSWRWTGLGLARPRVPSGRHTSCCPGDRGRVPAARGAGPGHGRATVVTLPFGIAQRPVVER